VQGIHRLAARQAGGVTVPVLVTPQRVLPESQEILRWVDERTPAEHRLFPPNGHARDEVESLCRRFDEGLGPKARRLMYVHMLAQRQLALRFNDQGVPTWEDRALRYGWPVAAQFIRRALGIYPGVEAEDEHAVFSELDFVAERLARGSPYLCGESFCAADLTFAALSAAVTVPPQYGVSLPQPDALATPTATLVNRARAHPAGRYALKLFAEHRRQAIG
jgi:glutathione S-transferase